MHLTSERLVEFVAHPGDDLPGPDGYRVQRITTENDLCVLRDAWTGLVDEAPAATIFETWEWVTTWWRHYHQKNDLWVMAAWDRTERLGGIVSWMVAKDGWGPFRLHRLTFLGRNVASPLHLDLVAREDERADVAAAFVAYLEAHRPAWDVLDLGDMSADSPFIDCLGYHRERRRELSEPPARIVHLPDAWQLSQHVQFCGVQDRLERDYGGKVSFSEVTGLPELRPAVDAMTRLTVTGRASEETSAFDDDRFLAFYRHITAIALVNGWLRFYVLNAAGQVAGALCGLLYHRVFYCYWAASDPKWKEYDPMGWLFSYAIERAVRDGAVEFDMMRDACEYSFPWGSTERSDRHLLISSTWAGRLWSFGDGAWDAARAFGHGPLAQDVRRRFTHLLHPRSN